MNKYANIYAGKCGVCAGPLICPSFCVGEVRFWCDVCGEEYAPEQPRMTKFDLFVKSFPIAALKGIRDKRILLCLQELVVEFERNIELNNTGGQLKCLSQISNICRQYAAKNDLIQELLNQILEANSESRL